MEPPWQTGYVLDCHATTRSSIPVGYSVRTRLYVLCKGQLIGVPSLNDVDGMYNPTKQPTNQPIPDKNF